MPLAGSRKEGAPHTSTGVRQPLHRRGLDAPSAAPSGTRLQQGSAAAAQHFDANEAPDGGELRSHVSAGVLEVAGKNGRARVRWQACAWEVWA